MTGPAPHEFVELLAIVRGYQRSRAVTVAAELGIADLLRGGPRGVDDLAAATSTDAATLYRLLRALAAIGVLTEHDDRRFSLSSMGEYPAPRSSTVAGSRCAHVGADYQWRAWGELRHSVATGENAAVYALGTDVWEYRRLHPRAGRGLRREDADVLPRGTTPVCSLPTTSPRYGVIADIGGGTGAVLAAVLAAHPDSHGILFDQPHVVDSNRTLEIVVARKLTTAKRPAR